MSFPVHVHPEPSWQSEWFPLSSQAGSRSFMEVHHGLNKLPVKGKVLVRPMSGENAGLSFEGSGSQQWDDDKPVTYCGVVFVYNATHVRLAAPTVNNHHATGHIFCAGKSCLCLFVSLFVFLYFLPKPDPGERVANILKVFVALCFH